jgi:hypothetical protein
MLALGVAPARQVLAQNAPAAAAYPTRGAGPANKLMPTSAT